MLSPPELSWLEVKQTGTAAECGTQELDQQRGSHQNTAGVLESSRSRLQTQAGRITNPLQDITICTAKPAAAIPKASGLRSFTACGDSTPNAGEISRMDSSGLRPKDLYLHCHLQGIFEVFVVF